MCVATPMVPRQLHVMVEGVNKCSLELYCNKVATGWVDKGGISSSSCSQYFGWAGKNTINSAFKYMQQLQLLTVTLFQSHTVCFTLDWNPSGQYDLLLKELRGGENKKNNQYIGRWVSLIRKTAYSAPHSPTIGTPRCGWYTERKTAQIEHQLQSCWETKPNHVTS